VAPEFTASAIRPTSTANCRADFRDFNLSHSHHRIEDALGDSSIRADGRLRQGDRRNLKVQTPFVFAPATLTLFAAARDDGVPVAVRFGLIGGCDLKRERPVMLDIGAAVESDSGDAHRRELDGQYGLPSSPTKSRLVLDAPRRRRNRERNRRKIVRPPRRRHRTKDNSCFSLVSLHVLRKLSWLVGIVSTHF
jgi:hypothetical protein